MKINFRIYFETLFSNFSITGVLDARTKLITSYFMGIGVFADVRTVNLDKIEIRPILVWRRPKRFPKNKNYYNYFIENFLLFKLLENFYFPGSPIHILGPSPKGKKL